MKCIVTAGPAFEPLDHVRRLTNLSTGRLGSELANFLVERGHTVTLLLGAQATHRGGTRAQEVETFTTAADLHHRLKSRSTYSPDAIFHAAAVSDFAFGKVWQRSAAGELAEIKSGKFSTRSGTLLAELVPTPKIITELRDWHPRARLVGWKFEVDGQRADVIALGERQIIECRTDACVPNGPAYGPGFGLVTGHGHCVHHADAAALFAALESFLHRPPARP
jgi:phosphopantothenoylcysteine decarboxylase/phosphopantothenate--cysteine ligase